MGQDQVDAGAKPAGSSVEKLNQILKDNQFVNVELRDKFMADAMAPAPDSISQRLWTVAKDAVNQVPEAFVKSLDPNNILPNVGIGFGIGAAVKVALPEAGPVGKAAGGAVGAWFVGKPLVESLYMAASANTNIDMYKASNHLADSVGGLPVTLVEGAVGAKLGAMVGGKFMSSATAAPFATWKAKQYGTLDAKIDGADAAVRNSTSFLRTRSLDDESFVLNEHASDVFSRLVKQKRPVATDETGWIVGPDAWKTAYRGGALRDMRSPDSLNLRQGRADLDGAYSVLNNLESRGRWPLINDVTRHEVPHGIEPRHIDAGYTLPASKASAKYFDPASREVADSVSKRQPSARSDAPPAERAKTGDNGIDQPRFFVQETGGAPHIKYEGPPNAPNVHFSLKDRVFPKRTPTD